MNLEKQAEVTAYLDAVCAHVRYREVHEQIQLELLSHIESLVEEQVAEGESEQAAIQKALRQMGDAVVVGKQLHKTHQPRTEWGLFGLVALIVSIGMLTIYSIQAQGLLGHFAALFQKSLLWLFIGTALATCLYYYDYRKLKKHAGRIYGIVILVLVLSHFTGVQVNGKTFVSLGMVQIDFIGISPYLLTVALAGLFCKWTWDTVGVAKAFGLLMLPLVIYYMNFDKGAFLLYLVAFFLLMTLSGAKRYQWLGMASAFGGFFALFLLSEPYRMKRMFTFLNPYADPKGAGWLHVQIHETIASAGWWGQGFTFPAHWLPEVHTDMIFPYMVYTFGWVFGAIFLVTVLMLLYRMAATARVIKEPFGRNLIHGFTGIIGFGLLWNMLNGSGLAPGYYVALPFISYGGSQLLINLVATGLVLGVFRRKDLIPSDGRPSLSPEKT
ncbi:FtsW/RodA/SpoVE family cell cycle protein [Heliobacterium gestii]|uniref:FtsW/RodA/SpoVE family cell cycle protein n=1 Tax=Heliomicrobium gestii TaxID=2699 RepID=A0A845LHM5_HELGE|nr:FtsW/RodA/SpoVE family cell cycle protein [Heliomicrobium gestii]MBM7867686.1 cell division protein FtsW (lipid II flippase) [Heliomicrobium gestii]MZP44079.1 FtsW/RodA/SpoVE family cell cycle protein [Heliomicrobium gestii]